MESRTVISWREAFVRALGSGSAASVLSGITLALCGKLERNAPAGPLNAPSQWFLGERAAHRRAPSLHQTTLGYSIHHAVSIGWASVHEKHVVGLIPSRSPAARLAECAFTAAFAYFTDYHIARGRLQPGFEKHISGKSLFASYAAFGLGLALGSWFREPPPRRRWRR